MSDAATIFRDRFPDAAKGDLDAQRALVHSAIQLGREGSCSMFFALYDATLWARIAASHGEPVDQHMLAACLCYFGEQCSEDGLDDLATTHVAESIALLDKLADEGSEIGGECLNQLADNLPLHVLDMARKMREEA